VHPLNKAAGGDWAQIRVASCRRQAAPGLLVGVGVLPFPYALFVELQLLVVVVGLPFLAVYEVAGADLGKWRAQNLFWAHVVVPYALFVELPTFWAHVAHVAVPYALFLELRFLVVVVGLPLLAVYEVAGADLDNETRSSTTDLRLLSLDGVGNWKAGNYVGDGSAKGTQ
jgi:hypothetical protein